MKKIYLLLTRTQSSVSRVVHFVTKDTYTHASLAFDPKLSKFYSSTRKNGKTLFPAGPSNEYLGRGFFARYGKTPCVLLELEVPSSVFDTIYKNASYIVNNNRHYKFNIIGLFSCRFGKPFYQKNHYFCSQFVAEMLNSANAVALPKESGLIRPADFLTVPEFKKIFEGDIKDLEEFAKMQ